MDLDQLQNLQRKRILFDCVSGSRAYGTAHADSDTDIRGIFAQPAHGVHDASRRPLR
jgi:predicted nucleotidyltransferase